MTVTVELGSGKTFTRINKSQNPISTVLSMQEVFGCTETTGPQATNKPDFGCFKPGSVGREHVGVQAGTAEVVWSF